MLTGLVSAHAQTVTGKSEVFQEPLSEGWTKMIMLKNGNTFYFHYGSKKGIETYVWDKDRKLVNKVAIKSDNWQASKKRRVKINGLYEIGGEPVIFLEYYDGRTPVLYRLRLNPNDGSLLKEETVSKLQMAAHADFDVTFKMYGGVEVNNNGDGQDVIVEKDAESDNYGVISYYGNKKSGQHLRVQLFDGSHKLINSGSYTSPDPDFKKLNIIGATVEGNRVFIATYGALSAKGKNAHVFISCLRAGDTVLTTRQLDFTEDFKNTNSQMVYNHNSNSIVMLTNTLAEKKSKSNNYVSFLSYIDPENLALNGVHVVSNEYVNRYAHDKLNIEMNYAGLPQKVIVNSDNTLTVLQEDMSTQEVYSSRGGHVATYTFLGNIGVTEIGNDGKEKAGYALMKKQMYGGELNPLYMAGRDKGLWVNESYSSRYVDDNLFLSYEYIHTPTDSYVLFNDNPKNNKKSESKKKRKATTNTDYINTICYKLKDGTATRTYLFGEPEKKKKSRACYIETSYFDRKTNTYVTIESDENGSKYNSYVIWMHFD